VPGRKPAAFAWERCSGYSSAQALHSAVPRRIAALEFRGWKQGKRTEWQLQEGRTSAIFLTFCEPLSSRNVSRRTKAVPDYPQPA